VGGGDAASVGASTITSGATRMNNVGDSHCYHCGGEGHWANKCQELAEEQQAQLHMMVEGTGEGDEQAGQTAHQTVIAFKSKNHLKIIHTVARGVNINCNAGNLKTNQQGEFGTMKVWYIPEGIANIFLMNELEKKYPITYDSWEWYYVVHTQDGPVKFYKDENGLPYIDLKDSEEDAAMLLVQMGSEEAASALVQRE
jgi:hypothetical protein